MIADAAVGRGQRVVGDDGFPRLAVAAGLDVNDARVAESLLRRPAPIAHPIIPATSGERHQSSLSTREREVLDLIARGMPNKQIAAKLGISSHTVKFHIGSLLVKLGAASRAEAVTLGARRGELVL